MRRLAALGINDCEISRRLDVPRTTVRDIARPRYVARSSDHCHRCWLATKPVRFTDELYAYVLGFYLGDGCIAQAARTFSLRLSLDAKYPGVIAEARAALETMFPDNPVNLQFVRPRRNTAVLGVWNRHLPCVFPQHGPGKKHDRRIALESWQSAIVERAPWPLLRGLIHSDGCRFVNRTGRYEYPSYAFCQVSHDIRGIFTSACDLVGIQYRDHGRSVRMNRRATVALMDRHIGGKK